MAGFGRSNLSHNVFELERIFSRAARYGISEWNRPFSEQEDLKQKLWEWYLKRPSTQEKLQALETHQVTNMVKRIAVQLLVESQTANDKWDGKNHYEVENVKDALKGKDSNRYLAEILPAAFKALADQSPEYADAIRSRYFEGRVPDGKSAQNRLVRAHVALTSHVNHAAITAELERDSSGRLIVKDGPGSRRIMQKNRPRYTHEEHPELIKGKGDHSDPTANIAIMLMENPELRDEYLYETPINEFLRGRG